MRRVRQRAVPEALASRGAFGNLRMDSSPTSQRRRLFRRARALWLDDGFKSEEGFTNSERSILY